MIASACAENGVPASRIRTFAADLSSEQHVSALYDAVISAFGRVDIRLPARGYKWWTDARLNGGHLGLHTFTFQTSVGDEYACAFLAYATDGAGNGETRVWTDRVQLERGGAHGRGDWAS